MICKEVIIIMLIFFFSRILLYIEIYLNLGPGCRLKHANCQVYWLYFKQLTVKVLKNC